MDKLRDGLRNEVSARISNSLNVKRDGAEANVGNAKSVTTT